jgi:hypothetical protein
MIRTFAAVVAVVGAIPAQAQHYYDYNQAGRYACQRAHELRQQCNHGYCDAYALNAARQDCYRYQHPYPYGYYNPY